MKPFRFAGASLVLGAATLALVADARLTHAQPPTPDFVWNNFISSGTTWANANNWVPAGPPTSSVDRVLQFNSSPLQTVTGYTTSNGLGAFDLNAMVFNALSNSSGGVTVTNLTATDTLQFNTSSTGTLPSIWQLGTGRVTISHNQASPQTGITLAGGAAGTTLRILGDGVGDVYLNTSIAQTGTGASGLLINQTGTRNFFSGSVVRLGGSTSNFTGGVNLTAGNLMLSNVIAAAAGTPPAYTFNGTASVAATPVNSLGTGTLTINGGSLQFDPIAISSGTSPSGVTGTLQVNNNIVLNATMNLTGVVPATAPSGNIIGIFANPISGNGGINVAPTNGTLNFGFTGANTFNGPVNIAPIGLTAATVLVGTANVSTGSFANVPAFTVTGSSTLTLNNVFGVQTRLNTVTPPTLTLNRGNFNLFGNASANATETFGLLTVTGMGSLTVQSGSGTAQTASLTFSGLNRGADGRGTLSITATNLGSGTGAGEGILLFTTDPGGAVGGGGATGTVTRSILPYAMANSQNLFAGISGTLTTAGTTLNGTFISGGSTTNLGLVRWDSATQRIAPLNLATEYATNLYLTGTSAPTANMRLASNSTTPLAFGAAGLNQPTTVNALVLDTNTLATAAIGVSVAGTGTLTVGGGAILVGTNGSTAAGTVTLPSMINLGGLNFGATTGYIHTSASLTVNAPITGSAGVVKSQTGTLVLNGTNTFTGGLSVNAGIVQFATDANLGAAGGSITLNAGQATGLNFVPNNPFGFSGSPNLTTARPVTLGAAGGVVNVGFTNSNLTMSGIISGSGPIFKSGAGILTLSGANTYTGTTVAAAGLLVAANDGALGAPSSSVILAGATFQPGSSFLTNRDFLNTAQSLIFTNGQNLTINGNVTQQTIPGAFTLFKVGTGDLTLTAANGFSGSFQLGESTPAVRATSPTGAQTSGRLILTGANGSLAQSSSVFSIAGGEIILDNSTAVNQNRLGNVTLSLIGGNATLIGNATTPVNEQIGALSINNANNQYGGRMTVVSPTGAGATTLTATAAFSTQTGPNVGTLFIRATNLGAATGDRGVVILPTNPAQTNGLIPSIVVATSDTAADPTTFATTATVTNAAPNSNQFSVVPFTAYTAGTGALGAGAAASTYDVTAAASFTGTSAANALRIGAGGSVDLNAGTLTLSAGNILAAGGANGGITSTGGTATLNYAAGVAARFSVATGSDLTVNANIVGTTGGLTKLGGGVLTINGSVSTTTGLMGIAAGTLRYGTANVLPTAGTVFINTGATLDLNNTNSTLAGLIGWGDTNIGTGSLTLNIATTPILAYGGGFVGSGTLIKTGTAGQVLAGNSPSFNGGVQILAGTLTVQSTGALGNAPILLGDTTGANQALLTIGAAVTTFSNSITVQAGGSTTARHTITMPSGASTFASNVAINNTTNSYTSGGITLNGVGLQFSGTSGVTGGLTTQTGVISGPGALLVFSGNWSFAGNNTYAGGTMFDTTTASTAGIAIDSTPTAGTVTSGPFGTGPVLFSTGFGINLRADGGARTIANAIQLSATGGYFGVIGTNPLTFNGGFDLQGAAVVQSFQINNTARTTINGAITNGTAGIAKNGPGVLAVTGANTYTGTTTVNAGTLLVNGTGTIPGATQVNTGAIFGGTGTATGLITLANGGILAPGDTGASTLTAGGGLTTVAGSIVSIRITNASTPAAISTGGSTLGTLPNPTSNNFLNITGGTTTIDVGTLFAIDGSGLSFTVFQPYSYQIAQGAGSQAGLNIATQTQFFPIGFQATGFSVTGSAGGAIYVNFTPVPEPTTTFGIAVAGLAVAGYVRRRRQQATA
ncbi:MAG: autotransporter-associated beta strand repeat-containing protein [Gemmataceae bacterium]